MFTDFFSDMKTTTVAAAREHLEDEYDEEDDLENFEEGGNEMMDLKSEVDLVDGKEFENMFSNFNE